MAIEVVRKLMLASQQAGIVSATVRCHSDVASYLNNRKRRELVRLEEETKLRIQILGIDGHYPEHLELELRDGEGRDIKLPE